MAMQAPSLALNLPDPLVVVDLGVALVGDEREHTLLAGLAVLRESTTGPLKVFSRLDVDHDPLEGAVLDRVELEPAASGGCDVAVQVVQHVCVSCVCGVFVTPRR